jgi:hypothetical protein
VCVKEVKVSEEKKTIHTGGGAHVGGNVTVSGGDFVGRDKIQTTTGVTPAQFLSLLAELRQTLAGAGLDADTAQVIEADVQVVEAQVQKPQPGSAIIVGKLRGVAEVLTETAKTAASVAPLAALAQKALAWAGQLFG